MKKTMYLVVAGFFFLFRACSGGANTEEAATDAPAEEVAPAAAAAPAQEAADVEATEENEEANEDHSHDGHSH